LKRTVFTVIFTAAALLIVPLTLLAVVFFTPSQFCYTYYSELSSMYSRLKSAEGKKIVIIGNSSVAFGVDTSIIEDELKADGFSYTVCSFGLYGSIGTKAMLDLSEKYIGEGDIVLFSPEIEAQSLSLYFSSTEMWRAADSDFSILPDISLDDFGVMVGGFTSYAAEKFSYILSGEKASSGEVYSKASFNSRCDMVVERAYNIMSGGADENNPISLDCALFGDDFISYVNEYYSYIKSAGGEMYYSFAPMNKLSLSENYESELDLLADYISDKFDFLLLGDPHRYAMDSYWFYDSNFHLNSSGAVLRSIYLTDELKLLLGSSSPVSTPLPSKPEKPAEENNGDGDNTCIDCFEYALTDGGYVITALTDKGRQKDSIIVPYSYNGINITSFYADVFAENKNITEITLQENIRALYDECLSGCTSLKKLILKQSDPEKISVGYSLLSGAEECRIYVKKQAFSSYSTNYYWGHYAGKYVVY